ncbi:uncharacterized protein LOC120035655, partial [Salvelinus namaycush]|uniref:Uncharacterized protein LOC120035655 n=1 Tax=Salvelinus namaycush TaxID=8040 RepID=A0A8U0U3B7_SALNM
GCHGDGDHEEIMERPLQSDSDAATSTIYATANLPTSYSDSPHYASVNFHKNPSGPNEATDTITKEGSCPNEANAAITTKGTSSCDYATGCHGDSDYEEIKERPLRSDSDAATSTIYATANLPTSHSDSLHYASVNFHKNPSGPNEATDSITKEGSCPNETTAAITTEGTSSCDYATVNKSPAYSTVNHPHSCSEAPPIYSTISKPRDT